MLNNRLIVLGTRNAKKRDELAELLAPVGVELRTLTDFPESIDVVEDGDTFTANAQKKAAEQARHLGHWVLGEDSGLCVDALDGRPGVYSARYASPTARDDENNAKLIEELKSTLPARRTAYYVCHASLADPQGNIRIDVEETCRGRIREQPAGNAGFGYDPLFEIVEYHRTFGQLGRHVKSAISHRARAIREMVRQIKRLVSTNATAEF